MHRAEQEVIDLHQFFEGWLTGHLPRTEANLARFQTVMSDQFLLISPSGSAATLPDLLPFIEGAHGTRPQLRIWIKNFQIRHEDAQLLLATYEEWQQDDQQPTTARLSSVVFQPHNQAPNGVVWLHLHETWLPSDS